MFQTKNVTKMTYFRRCIASLCLLPMIAAGESAAEKGTTMPTESTMTYVLDKEGKVPQPVVAIDQVCAWPNLTQLPGGDIVALIYNQSSHGQLPGDVDCWASTDEGETWTKRSTAAPRGTPEQNRMNVAAGLTAAGDLILVSSGWSAPGNPDAWNKIGHILPAWVCISKDNGVTWSIDKESFPKAPDGRPLIPFGDIMTGADGKLRVATYCGPRGPADGDAPAVPPDNELAQRAAAGQNWVVRGDGLTWDAPVPLCEPTGSHPFNETALLHLGEGRWLAAARFGSGSMFPQISEDDAKTWKKSKRIKGFPGHLLRLADGTILLSYGKRGGEQPGVEAMFSDDEGRTWSEPYRILNTRPGNGDLGYPSSIQRKDGQVVTAYYEGNSGKRDYFMGVAVWDPERTRNAQRGTQKTEMP
jgi:hypothetical protein